MNAATRPQPPEDQDAARDAGAPARRRWLLGAAATLGLGAGFAAWRQATGPGHAAVDDPATRELWRLSFSTPDGGTLAMASLQGRPLLINFWATWCPPCVEELPLLDAFYRENKANGMQLIGIAADSASAVQIFTRRMPLSFPLVLAGMSGIELSRTLGNLTGALPFSVLLTRQGAVAQRKMGQLRSADLSAWRQAA